MPFFPQFYLLDTTSGHWNKLFPDGGAGNGELNNSRTYTLFLNFKNHFHARILSVGDSIPHQTAIHSSASLIGSPLLRSSFFYEGVSNDYR